MAPNYVKIGRGAACCRGGDGIHRDTGTHSADCFHKQAALSAAAG
jgi:hypothetical protein